MHTKVMAVAGTAVVALAVLVSVWADHWLKTRTFKPVDMPVLLGGEKIQTAVFEINLRETYSVYVDMDYSINDYYKDRCNYKNLWGSHWTAYRQIDGEPKNTRVWASSEDRNGNERDSQGFHAEPGMYWVEWQSPPGAACLNDRHPRLKVLTGSIEYEQTFGAIQNACLFTVAVGAGALLRAIVLWLAGIRERRNSLRMIPEMTLQSVIPLRRRRPIPLMKGFPNFGLVYGFILWVLMFVFMIMPRTPTGLPVDFKRERTVIVEKNPWAETMAVYVDAKRRFFVNGNEVAREELRPKLEEELLRRGVWVVYFEADDNCLYMDAVYAMDTIQGLGAKMIWITPKTREEWKKSAVPTHPDRGNRIP